MTKLVAYYRVSTQKQGSSGLGLDAQREAVHSYSKSTSSDVIAEYEEIESGKDHINRPKLKGALEYCELTGAKLVIAKLDRLSRNVAFLANLMESGVQFIACDNPQANELTIHILAAVAEAERKAISERTRVALAAAKIRGVKLGNPRIAEARKKRKCGSDMTVATNARQAKAKQRANKIMKMILVAKNHGALSMQQIADYLNIKTNIKTSRGCMWTRSAISRVIKITNTS